MRETLEHAYGYHVGQAVVTKVTTIGSNADDQEITIAAGAMAEISGIEHIDGQGISFELVITAADGHSIVNAFDERDGPPDTFFSAAPASV